MINVKSAYAQKRKTPCAYWSDPYEKMGVRYVDIVIPTDRQGLPMMLYCEKGNDLLVSGVQKTVREADFHDEVKRANKMASKKFEGKETEWVALSESRILWNEAKEMLHDTASVLTTETLFNKASEALKLFPELKEAIRRLDYCSCADSWNPQAIYGTERFSITSEVAAGGSEGVYADIYLEEGGKTTRLAVFKTLDEPWQEGASVYSRMGQIAGVFSSLATQYIWLNYDRFEIREEAVI